MLFPVSASLTFVGIVRVTKSFSVEFEQLTKIVLGEMSGRIFSFVHDASRQILFLTPVAGSAIDTEM